MPALRAEIKRYITRCAACFDSPSEIVKQVKAEFGIEISRSVAQRYDPTKSRRSLSAELRQLFDGTRKRFIEEVEILPLVHRATRLRRLEGLYEQARAEGQHKIALGALRAAHQECLAFEFVVVPESADDNEPGIRITGGMSQREPGTPHVPMFEMPDPFDEIPDGDLVDPLGISPTHSEEPNHASPKTPP